MSFIIKYYRFLFAAIALIIIALIIGTCSKEKRRAYDFKALSDFQSAKIDSFKNAAGKKVYEAPVQQTANADDIKKLSEKYFGLKKNDEKKMQSMQSLIVAQQHFRLHDTVIIYLPQDVEVSPDSMVRAGNVVMPGTKFSAANKYYSFSGTIELQGFHLENLEAFNEISFRAGEKKRGIFRSSMMTVQAIDSNPYITITGINSITLKNRQSQWSRWIKPVLVGAAASFITYKYVR